MNQQKSISTKVATVPQCAAVTNIMPATNRFLSILFFALIFLYNPGITMAVCSPCQAAASRSAQAKQDLLKEKTQPPNSFTHLYHARIESVGDNYLTVSKEGRTYGVQITAQTQLRRRFGGQSTFSEQGIGDTISVFGQWSDSSQSAITARMIKNLSIQRRWGAFFGTVQSATEDNMVISTINRGDLTVYIDVNTGPIDRVGKPILLSDFQVGHKIRVKGVWDKNKSEIRQAEEIKNFILPLPGVDNINK